MTQTRRGGRQRQAESEPAPEENGYYFIQDLEDDEFDYGPRDPGADPPIGQATLSDRLRQLYGWCAAYVQDDGAYRDFLRRLRAAFSSGAVQEKVKPGTASNLMDEIERDLAITANALIAKTADTAAVWSLAIMVMLAICYAALKRIEIKGIEGIENYLLVAAAAVAALAVKTRAREKITKLTDHQSVMELYYRPWLSAITSALLAIGAALCVQNKLVTLAVRGEMVNVQDSVTTALAIGFIFGFADIRLLGLILRAAERVIPGPSGSRQARRHPGGGR
jgi:hypothetical protein